MAMVNPEQVIFLFDTIKEDDPLFEKTVLDCHETDSTDNLHLWIFRR